MNINEELKRITMHWDKTFQRIEPQALTIEDFKGDNPLSEAIIKMANESKQILDIGTGSGYALFTSAFHGKTFKHGIGIDPSPYVIKTLNEICKLSNITNLEFILGDHTILKNYEDARFDGIICSNVLDVLPEPITIELITSIKRLLKPGGTFILKLNFFLTDPLIEKLKMEEVAPNTFKMNDVIRGLNYPTQTWIKWFEPLTLVSEDTFERLKDGPKDRLLVFRKEH